MGVPRGPGAGLKGDVTAGHSRRVARLEQRIDADGTGEILRRSLADGCEPLRLISIVPLLLAAGTVCAAAPATAATSPPVAAIACLRVIMSVSFGRTSDPCVILRSSMAIAYARSGELRQVVELSYNLQRSRSTDRVIRNRFGRGPLVHKCPLRINTDRKFWALGFVAMCH